MDIDLPIPEPLPRQPEFFFVLRLPAYRAFSICHLIISKSTIFFYAMFCSRQSTVITALIHPAILTAFWHKHTALFIFFPLRLWTCSIYTGDSNIGSTPFFRHIFSFLSRSSILSECSQYLSLVSSSVMSVKRPRVAVFMSKIQCDQLPRAPPPRHIGRCGLTK